jgi:hypothetical protein
MRKLFAMCLMVLLAAVMGHAEKPASNDTEIKPRVDAFARAWLERRDGSATLAFIDDSAYGGRPVTGSACDGWYRTSMPEQEIRQTISANLINSANDLPKGLTARRMLKSEFLAGPWKQYAVNSVDSDGYLLVEMNEATENGMFHTPEMKEHYAPLFGGLRQKNGRLYWAVMPMTLADGDIFVVVAGWQHTRDNWYITHIDIICQ